MSYPRCAPRCTAISAVSLKLTLTAGSGAKRKTTTTRVSALRLS